jgi:hypothetical protein
LCWLGFRSFYNASWLIKFHSHLVDIFAMVPQNFQRSPSTFSAKDARVLQYQDVLANLPNGNDTSLSSDSVHGQNPPTAGDWLSDDEDDGVIESYQVNKPETTSPLLGGFQR